MKRLLAFAACSTVAGLLLMRILPELAAGHERKVKPEKENIRAELNVAETPIEVAPDAAIALLLPPPPAPESPPVSVAAQVTEALKPVPEQITPISERPQQAPPEIMETVQDAAIIKTPRVEQAEVTAKAHAPEISTAESALSPRPRPIVKPLVTQARISAAQSESMDSPRSPPRPEINSVRPGRTVEAEGRVLLRILEHGSGPEIEIAWPVSAIQRRALYRLFEACYGMEVALIDSGGRLFGHAGQSGQPWQPNLDRFSGFVRQPAGRLTPDEKDSVARIRAFHGGLRAANNVRLFPRRLDALLLGGLKALAGERYAGASAIRAHYRRDGNTVLVEGIRLDGRPILGRIDLSKGSRRCRSGDWS